MGHRPSHLDTVVAVKRTALAVCWLAINQKVCTCRSACIHQLTTYLFQLDIADAQNRKRPPRFWSGKDLLKLIMVRSKPHHDMRVGDKVVLKNAANLPVTKHGRASDPAGVIEVQTLVVKETRTTVDVLWQDGTRETVNSKELIPYVNPDEYDCWCVTLPHLTQTYP
jgi:ubiquitin-conjugating enzyme E2 O